VPDDTALLNLVDRIYDTVEAPESWPEVVREVAGATGGTKGLLFTPFHGVEEGGLWSAHEVAAEDLESYFSYFKDTDLWVHRAWERDEPTNVSVNCDRLVPQSELKRSEWFNDFLKPLDIRRCLSTILDGGSSSLPTVHLSIYRPVNSKRFGPEAEGVLGALIPHLRRALDLGFRFSALRHRARDRLAILDRLDFGVVSLDRDGAILFMNRRARKILASDDGIGIVNQRLVAAHRRDNDRLWALIRRTAVARRDGSHDAGGSMAVARPSAARPYAINVAPGSGLASLVNAPATAALVLITDPEDCPEPPVERIARLHGLTPAEARVAAALAGGRSLREYADGAGLSIHTVRTTLKRVFAKTETRSQADLVRLLLLERGAA
jgi:DNA-binding CsgD family transcriptional regulator/PAS domain-containing protein